MKLDGFGLFVQDMDIMVKFYNEVLGFNIKYKSEDKNVYLEKDNVLFLMYGRTDFGKMVNKKFTYPKIYNATIEIALSVNNYKEVDSIYNEIIKKGARSIMKPQTMPWAQRTCYISNPEGNLIEIGSFNV